MGVAGMGAVPPGLISLFSYTPGTAVPGYRMPPFGLVPESFMP